MRPLKQHAWLLDVTDDLATCARAAGLEALALRLEGLREDGASELGLRPAVDDAAHSADDVDPTESAKMER